ncbi:unnamed protein product [Orchesella dallaii]|uniref:Uncharacterized protein n=1 Tax=Orchesella dallaii TaxID=48710 RepID=A0ABP1RZJ5_9HEXA
MEGRPSQKINPVLRAVSVGALPSVPFDGIVCCYEYLGYEGSEKQVKACNIPSSEVFLEVCQLTAENRPRMRDNPHVLQHYDRIINHIRLIIILYIIFSSSTNLVQDHRKKSCGNESSSRRKKSKRKHDHVIETSDIFYIPTSSVSKSFEGKVRTGKSVQIEEPGGRVF